MQSETTAYRKEMTSIIYLALKVNQLIIVQLTVHLVGPIGLEVGSGPSALDAEK